MYYTALDSMGRTITILFLAFLLFCFFIDFIYFVLSLVTYLLKGKGAWRVHGGGFAGTVQAFVPDENVDGYKSGMEAVFGAGSCAVLKVRPEGCTAVL